MSRHRISNNGLMIELYTGKQKSQNTAIYFTGFPSTIGTNPLTEELTKKNVCILQPHYPGTYDSDGEFSPQSAIQMASIINNATIKNSWIDTQDGSNYTLPPIKYAVGNSFGCFIALKSLIFLPSVEKLFLFAPAITYGKADISSGFKESGPTFLDYVARSRPFTYRLGAKSEWESFYNGDLNSVIKTNQKSNLKEVIGIVGGKDSSFELKLLNKNFSKIIHQNFSNKIISKLITIPQAGHSINDMMTEEIIDEIDKL